MRFETVLRHWSGAALALVGVIATLWLAVTGRLTFYVHPRYTLLTVIMAVLTLLVLVVMAAVGVSAAFGKRAQRIATWSTAQRWRPREKPSRKH